MAEPDIPQQLSDLCLVGVMTVHYPLRQHIEQAISETRQLGLKVMLMTSRSGESVR